MARGRMIDREIYSHEDLINLPVETRYFYHGLIVWADDEGRLKAHPKYLKAKIFPSDNYSEEQIENMVNQLATIGCLLVYQVGDKRYIEHPKWNRWQTIRKDRYKSSDCPSSVDGIPVVDQWLTVGNHNLTKPNLSKPKENICPEPNKSDPGPVFISVPVIGQTKEASLPESKVVEWEGTFPGLDVRSQIRAATQWCRDNPSRRKTARGLNKFFFGWLERSQNSGRAVKKENGVIEWDRMTLPTQKQS